MNAVKHADPTDIWIAVAEGDGIIPGGPR